MDPALSPTDSKRQFCLKGGGWTLHGALPALAVLAVAGRQRLQKRTGTPGTLGRRALYLRVVKAFAHGGLLVVMLEEAKLTFRRNNGRAGSGGPGPWPPAGDRTRSAQHAGPAGHVGGESWGLHRTGRIEPSRGPRVRDRKHEFCSGHGGPGPSSQKDQPRSPATSVMMGPQQLQTSSGRVSAAQ